MVRTPVRVRPEAKRTLDQQIFVRSPGLTTVFFRLIARLPPDSRLRRAALTRGVRLGMEAFNRRDLDAVVIAFHPELEYYPYREFVEGALAEPCYRGHGGYRDYVTATADVWGADVRIEPTEVIDLGDRLVLLADMPMQAQASGISLTETYACVMTLKDGRVIRQRDFLKHAEALEAAGLGDET